MHASEGFTMAYEHKGRRAIWAIKKKEEFLSLERVAALGRASASSSLADAREISGGCMGCQLG
jgi:hypothetical protein